MAVVTDTTRPRLFDPAPRRAPGAARPTGPATSAPAGPKQPAARAFAPPPPLAPTRSAPVAAAAGRERTLEDLLASTWGGLRLTGSAACPLCGGELTARYGAGAGPVGGRCRSCGTELG